MLIYLALLIPIIATILLAVFFTKKLVWWEYLLILGIPTLTIFIGKYVSVTSQTNTTEYWNSYALSVVYEEAWDEWHDETCYRTVSCGEDCTKTESYDCSHRDYHPAKWTMTDNLGENYTIMGDVYAQAKKLWANETFKDMHRDFYTQDGDAYTTVYKDSLGLSGVLPLCIPHTYENKVKVSRSVFNYQKVDSLDRATYKLYDYPPKYSRYNFPALMGYPDNKALLKLQRYNALIGSIKQVHMMVMVFTDQPREAGQLQEALLKGSNKNEFILCIGQSKNKITWTKVISWTDQEKLKISVARHVKEMDTLNLETVVDYMHESVKKYFIRKNWHDFDYLTVEPTFPAIIITMIVTLLVTIGVAIFAVKNDFEL